MIGHEPPIALSAPCPERPAGLFSRLLQAKFEASLALGIAARAAFCMHPALIVVQLARAGATAAIGHR